MIGRATVFAGVAALAGQGPLVAVRGGGLIVAFILAEAARFFVLIWSVHRRIDARPARPRRKRISAAARCYVPMAATMSASTGLALVYDRLPYLMMSTFFGAATLALYSVVERIVAAPSQLISKALGDVYRQRASVLHRKEGRFDALTVNTIAATTAISRYPTVLESCMRQPSSAGFLAQVGPWPGSTPKFLW
jgi:O-antigen/teichoic acid export membrane protein